MLWQDRFGVETPEQIDVDLEVVGPGSRFVAQVTDWVFKWSILAIAAVAILVLVALLGWTWSGLPQTTISVVLAVCFVAAYSFFLGYDIYFEGIRNGQTPGKRQAGIRVVREGGGPVDVWSACVRNVVGIADFLPFGYLLGGLVMTLNRRAQRLGDMAAGTVVIRDRRAALPTEAPAWLREAGDEFTFRADQLSRCEPNDLHVLYSFFSRYRSLEGRARQRLAGQLRDIFLAKTGYQPTQPVESLETTYRFLASLYRDLDAARRNR